MSEALLKNQQLASDVPRPNLLQNGGFEQWHYGIGPFTLAAGGGGPDQWFIYGDGGTGTLSISRESATVDAGSQYSIAVTAVAGTSTILRIEQAIPVARLLRGKTFTVSFRVRPGSAAGTLRCYIYDDVNNWRYSSYNVGSGAWETITLTAPIAANATAVVVGIYMNATGTHYVDNATLVLGSASSDYVPAISYPDALPNERLATDISRLPMIINGGFEIWQRGTGPFTTSGPYTADRWDNTFGGGSAVSVSQIASTIGGIGKSSQVTYTHAGGGYSQYLQRIEDTNGQFANKTVTFSATVKSSVAGTVKLRIQGYSLATSANSPYNVGVGAERLSVTLTLPAGETGGLYCMIQNDIASCTVEINDATLVIGPVGADYQPLIIADELARCVRYYEVFGYSGSFLPRVAGAATAASQVLGTNIIHKALKPVAPTATRVGTWSVVNCAQPTMNAYIDGIQMATTSSAAGQVDCYPGVSIPALTIEANP